MREKSNNWGKILLLLLGLLGYQIVLHRVLSNEPQGKVAVILTLAPLMVGLAWYWGRTWRGLLGLGATAMLAILGWQLWPLDGARTELVYLLPHVGAYLFLFWLFGRTLVRGRQALITRIATLVHGELPVEIQKYTRALTWLWCGFFSGMALVSISLFAFASIETWSVFANLLNLPLIGALFLFEYVYRILRYPDFSHVSLQTTIQAFRNFREPGSKNER
ncbi:MAG: hypothetical protein ACKVP2_05155 [Burkholderiales bacterium]